MKKPEKLKKTLGLYDVFSVSTGAMFSSGFFLLPGLATAEAGPATVISYFIAGLLILPTLFSMAELCTAMPKAGGSFYFIDRSLGPLFGTVGGLGTWVALVFKSAFALIGMGAYLAIFIDFSVTPIAIALTVAFTLLNIFGVKETTLLQRILVTVLIVILSFFIVTGFLKVQQMGWIPVTERQFIPFMPFGFESVIFTTGLVFVSYAGLTKVASIAEEVKDPERNIPLGMLLSLGAASFLYVTGVYILIAVLPADELREDLTPLATASSEILDWLPDQVSLIIITSAAIAAFTSTANAGILSASRYPMAMARDKLLQSRFKEISKFGTPIVAVSVTGAMMIVIILSFSELGLAKLASAFQLLIFTILNLAVIIMRESNIPSYLPGYKSPFYPWMQVLGIGFSAFLILKMGMLSVLFSVGVILIGVLWFYVYARSNVKREGAIYHIFERLGRKHHKSLEDEFRMILKEKGPIDPSVYDNMIARADVLIAEQHASFEDALEKAARSIEQSTSLDYEKIMEHIMGEKNLENTPVINQIALSHFSDPTISEPELVIMRLKENIVFERPGDGRENKLLKGVILLSGNVSTKNMHLRLLSQLANIIDREDFLERWHAVQNKDELKECFTTADN
ncbi:MAG: amino acid permease [Cyclobacteriaceae bacterium]